jgi:hypothetical protein
MLEANYIVFHDILPKFNESPCEHYTDILLRLSKTCKLFHEIYGPKAVDCIYWHICNICEYREISCEECIKNGTKKCKDCTCVKCGLSTNLMSNKFLYDGECKQCNMPFKWVRDIGSKLIQSVTITYGDSDEKEIYNAEYYNLYEQFRVRYDNNYDPWKGLVGQYDDHEVN